MNEIHLKLNGCCCRKLAIFPFNFHKDFVSLFFRHFIFILPLCFLLKRRRLYDLTISSNLYAKSDGTSAVRNELSLFVLIFIESIQQK